MKLFNGDCLEVMKNIPEKSVDMVLCDLPYGMTDCKWDTIIPFDLLWEQYRRITKPNAHIVLFSAQPFTTKLIHSNMKSFRYCWYWVKNAAVGYTYARYQPRRKVEDICVFRFDEHNDNAGRFQKCREYLQSERKKSGKTLKEFQSLLGNTMTSHYFTNGKQFALPNREAYKKMQTTGFFQMDYDKLKAMYKSDGGAGTAKTSFTYNPQGLKPIEHLKKRTRRENGNDTVYDAKTLCKEYTPKYTGYPHNILYYDKETERLHPTQKPVALLEYLVKTYTNERDIVLDNCMGSGSTGVASVNTNRRFIGIEKEKHYYRLAKDRIESAGLDIA